MGRSLPLLLGNLIAVSIDPTGTESMKKRNFVKALLSDLVTNFHSVLFKPRTEETLKTKVLRMHIDETTDSGKHK